VVDARGRTRQEVSNRDPIPGATVTLNIDSELQKIAYQELLAWAAKGKPGAAVALDPQTGAVLALVSIPSYDPNLFVGGISSKDWKALQDNPLKPQINRAIYGAVAPGSTFKIITAAAGLEAGKTSVHDGDFCGGVIYLGRWAKRCHRRSGHGSVSFTSALARSCDVFFYHLGQRLGPETMAKYAREFGLGERTGVDLLRPGDPQVERAGTVPTPAYKKEVFEEEWVGGDTVDFAIGQSMLACTPIQMCNAAAAIGNGGTLYRPQLVKSIAQIDAKGRATILHQMKPEVLHKVGVSPETLRAVADGMRAVMVPGGTASHCAIPGVIMAGKTGTAQIRIRGRMRDNAWFVGYAPANNPRIAVCVFVETGGHGGTAAAPIARKIIARYLNVKIDGGQVVQTTD
jgi:penicillin-binding protein 2